MSTECIILQEKLAKIQSYYLKNLGCPGTSPSHLMGETLLFYEYL